MARNRFAGKHPAYKKRGMSTEAIAKKRSYDKQYNKSKKARKYRSALNKANRKAGTYGNGDRMDMAHIKGGLKKQHQSKNRANNRPKTRQTRARK